MLKHAVLFIQGGSLESRILKVRRSWLFRKEQPKTSTAVMSRKQRDQIVKSAVG